MPWTVVDLIQSELFPWAECQVSSLLPGDLADAVSMTIAHHRYIENRRVVCQLLSLCASFRGCGYFGHRFFVNISPTVDSRSWHPEPFTSSCFWILTCESNYFYLLTQAIRSVHTSCSLTFFLWLLSVCRFNTGRWGFVFRGCWLWTNVARSTNTAFATWHWNGLEAC